MASKDKIDVKSMTRIELDDLYAKSEDDLIEAQDFIETIVLKLKSAAMDHKVVRDILKDMGEL